MANIDKIKGTLLYTRLHEPVPAYAQAGAPLKPPEWKVSVAVADEDFVDEFEDMCSKIDAKVSLKKIKTIEFEDKYKCEPPEGAGKNVWVFTFRKSTELGKTGKPVPELYQPKLFIKQGNSIVDKTHSTLVGNGSKGIVSLDLFTRTNGSTSIYLKNVLVTELVEYGEIENEYTPGSEFSDIDQSSTSVKQQSTKAAPAKKTKAVPALDVEDDDIPF